MARLLFAGFQVMLKVAPLRCDTFARMARLGQRLLSRKRIFLGPVAFREWRESAIRCTSRGLNSVSRLACALLLPTLQPTNKSTSKSRNYWDYLPALWAPCFAYCCGF